MLATGGVMACIQPLRAGEERYAVSFAVPMNAKGLKILSRKSYEENAASVFDNPLASRFDENDAILYFDDVKVEWTRVFINQDIAMCQRQFHATPSHVYQNYQSQIRLMVKMRFLVGIARRIAETNGIIGFPQVHEMLGSLAAQNTMVDALVHAMEVKGKMQGEYFIPDGHTLYSAQVLTQQLYMQVITALRELAGGGLIMLPSSVRDFANAEMRNLIDRTQQSPTCSSEGRVKFFKLAWDAVGSEFASRHAQYEMFYAGAPLSPRATASAPSTGTVAPVLSIVCSTAIRSSMSLSAPNRWRHEDCRWRCLTSTRNSIRSTWKVVGMSRQPIRRGSSRRSCQAA
jgi:4-hydroxyphenylacetate 3-monooxygenase